jgi:small subunit ribosomal protein S2
VHHERLPRVVADRERHDRQQHEPERRERVAQRARRLEAQGRAIERLDAIGDVERHVELERGREDNAFEFYTKKERLLLERERIKLDKYFSGVKDMSRLPGALFVVDAKREEIAVREAARLGIPVIAIADTNADPDMIDFPIPGNDDAIRSVSLIARAIADSIEAARREIPDERGRSDDQDATTYSTETGEAAAAGGDDRRRPRRKRRPRPEAIAQLTRPEEGGAAAGSSEGAPTEG